MMNQTANATSYAEPAVEVLAPESTVEEQAEQKTAWTAAEIILAARYFFPILTTPCWFLAGVFMDRSQFLMGFCLALAGIGVLFALTVAAKNMLKFPFSCIAAGFSFCRGFIPVYGLADVMAAIFGVALGGMFGLAAILIVPAAFSIKKFFED